LPYGTSPHAVRIGRTLQSFPPSKRSGRLSSHSAFQLACGLRKGRFAVADGEAHQSQRTGICFPLYIRLLPFLTGVPWRAFTLSMPLQHGLWLLRRLRPPSRPLAFSRPTYVGETSTEFPSSIGREKQPVAASCTPGGVRNNVCRTESRHTNRLPVLGRVYQPLSPVGSHDAHNGGSLRQHRSQGWSVIHRVVHRCRTFVRTLQTLACATVQRLVRSPYVVVQT
jgi:hypothetical protein